MGIMEDSMVENIYDFDLEQWGLKRTGKESLNDYIDRVRESPLNKSKNFSSWDLSPEGARQINSLYKTDPRTHYFTFPTYASKKQKENSRHRPDSEMAWHLWHSSYVLGKYEGLDSTWYENDGVVNTISMGCPTTGEKGPEPSKDYDGISIPGVWQNMGKIHEDHHEIIGHSLIGTDPEPMKQLFLDHCELLGSLD